MRQIVAWSMFCGLLLVGVPAKGDGFLRLHKLKSSTAAAPAPLPAPAPNYGQAMGATTFNYGYFGAQRHCQLTTAVGYYGEYHQKTHVRGD